jgi:hypothetical protein
MQTKAYKYDITAITLSGLCLMHCLLLPVLISSLPLLSVLSEAEWVHKLLVLIAVPVSVIAFSKTHKIKRNLDLPVIIALIGIVSLLSAVFVEAFHDMETTLTVIGALMLASAHIWRWKLHEA